MLGAHAWLGFAVVVALFDLGCTIDNPAFDPPRETTVADGPETGDAGSGDGDPGDGDPGDGDPGDGDGDPGDGDGDGDPGCEPPLTTCDGDCVDLGSDPSNCGQCGQPCFGTCAGGSCINEAHRIVFTTSKPHNGAFGGFEGADSYCNESAAEAGLSGVFMAWISTAQLGPAARMTHFMGPYRLPNGELIANDWIDLTDGALAHAIDSDEFGELPPAAEICEGQEVWTNTDPDGTPLTELDCQGWTSADQSATSNAGQWSGTMFSWTASGCVSIGCAATAPIYCVQQ
jgi:hypothetical protein